MDTSAPFEKEPEDSMGIEKAVEISESSPN